MYLRATAHPEGMFGVSVGTVNWGSQIGFYSQVTILENIAETVFNLAINQVLNSAARYREILTTTLRLENVDTRSLEISLMMRQKYRVVTAEKSSQDSF